MTPPSDEPVGPAKVVYSRTNATSHPWLEIHGVPVHLNESESGMYELKDEINRALAPLIRRSSLASRLAEALKDGVGSEKCKDFEPDCFACRAWAVLKDWEDLGKEGKDGAA